MAVTPPRPLLEGDNRSDFDCGQESLNGWFHRHAWANHVGGASRVNVIIDPVTGRIAGYVSLSAAQIERAFLPKPQQRNRPDPVPVTLLGQLAIDLAYQSQSQSHAASPLIFALRTALQASESIGSAGVLTHPSTTASAASMPVGVLPSCPMTRGAPCSSAWSTCGPASRAWR